MSSLVCHAQRRACGIGACDPCGSLGPMLRGPTMLDQKQKSSRAGAMGDAGIMR